MKKNYSPDEPIAAIATSLAPAALGIIRTSGTASIELVSRLFSRPQALLSAAANTLVYGWITEPGAQKAKDGRKIDEVMIGVYRAPKSFTGEEMAEIFCHGGQAAILAIHELLLKNGFRAAEKGEFTFRAFVNGKTGLTEAEAVREIIDAKTGASARRAAQRLNGSLDGEIRRVKDLVVRALAALEAQTEYPEDENAISGAWDEGVLAALQQELEDLCASWKAEKLYQDGAKAVLCGRTNAGKSSLFNAFLKEERAIVSDIHGTTRDWLESWVSFEGLPVRLFDTAGLRETDDSIEKQGVERSKNLAGDADIILYAADSAEPPAGDDAAFLLDEAHTAPIIFIWNKIDKSGGKPAGSEAPEVRKILARCAAVIPASAKTGAGISEIIAAVKKTLLNQAGQTRSFAGLGSERQKKAADEALQSVIHARQAGKSGFGADAVIQDLEDALASLAEITGEVTPDDILESVFANFCLGK